MDIFQTRFLSPALDSMTCAIPVSFVTLGEVYSDRILQISEQTGEMLEVKSKPVTYDKNGIKFGAKLAHLFGKDYLYVTINSKLLCSSYLAGLNSSNFRTAFNFAKNALDFEVDYFVFIANAVVFDCDLKIDFHANDEIFNDFLAEHKKFAHTRLFRSSYGSYLDLSYFSGLQFVNRKDATLGKPFVKFYAKHTELIEKSQDFQIAFQIQCNRYYRRLEFTIKNSAHFEYLKLGNKLLDLLNLSPNDITQLVLGAYRQHIGTPIVTQPPDTVLLSDFTVSKWCTYHAFLSLMESSNSGLTTILNEFLDTFPSITPQTKSRKMRQFKAEFKTFMQLQRRFDLTRFRQSANDVFLTK